MAVCWRCCILVLLGYFLSFYICLTHLLIRFFLLFFFLFFFQARIEIGIGIQWIGFLFFLRVVCYTVGNRSGMGREGGGWGSG